MFGKYIENFFNGKFWLSSGNVKNEDHATKTTPSKVEIKVKEEKNISAPYGYIPCVMSGISVERLHQEHNIVLKSILVEDKLFIQSIILLNEPKEFDCFADGENDSMTIKEIDEGLLSVVVKEKSSNTEKFYIRKGKIEIKL